MSESSITVAILAGGAASRLGGRDKGLEKLAGRPLIAWVCSAIESMRTRLESSAIDHLQTLIVANRSHHQYSAVAHTIADRDDVGTGPLAAVASALACYPTQLLLSLPVDCPTPPFSLLQRLVEALEHHECAVAHDGERRQPLFALYQRGLFESARAASQAGQGPRQWQQSLDCVEVDFRDSSGQFRNLNSVDDFTRFTMPA